MKIVTGLLAALMLVGVADAQTINQRRVNQQKRIIGGATSGELTKEEAARLERKQNRTQRQITRDRLDGGGMTAAERQKAQRKLDRNSRQIYREKHDAQTR